MPPLCEAELQWEKTELAAAPPAAPAEAGAALGARRRGEQGPSGAAETGPAGRGVLRCRGHPQSRGVSPDCLGGEGESGGAGELVLARAAGHPRPVPPSPAKSLYPALNLMTQIRALKVFATDRTRSFINNDLHIDA